MKKTRIKNPKISKALKEKHHQRIKGLINSESDYIYAPAYHNSLKELMNAYPNQVPDSLISKVLRTKASEINDIFNKVLTKLKNNFKKE